MGAQEVFLGGGALCGRMAEKKIEPRPSPGASPAQNRASRPARKTSQSRAAPAARRTRRKRLRIERLTCSEKQKAKVRKAAAARRVATRS